MILQGTAGPVEQVKRYGFNPQRGFYTVEVYTGTRDNINALLPGLIASQTAYDVVELESGLARLEITYSSDTVTGGNPPATAGTAVWELLNNVVQVDILDSQISTVTGLDPTTAAEPLRAYIEKGIVPSPALTGDALKLYLLIKAGVRAVEVSQPIIRFTTIVSSAYANRASMTNCGRILQKSTLQSEGVPATILWNLDDLSDTAGVTKTITGSNNYWDYGWLKLYPNVAQQTFNTWQIVFEYRFGLWSRTLYNTRV